MLSTLKLCWTFPSSTISFAFPFSSQSRRSRSILPANLRVKMSSSFPSDRPSSSSSCIPPLPENTVVVRVSQILISICCLIFYRYWCLDVDYQLGCGAVNLDYLAAVASFPKPNDKIRSTSLKVRINAEVRFGLIWTSRISINELSCLCRWKVAGMWGMLWLLLLAWVSLLEWFPR